jgi:Na+-translocating ferredoxin:NAD+ oxidoreductase RnfD subunit
MRKQAIKIVTMFSLLLMLTTAAVHAQSKRISIDIPFSFTVGQKTLPAGEYTVEPNRGDSPTVWLIQSKSGHDGVLFITSSAWARETKDKTRLVFNSYEGQYFLSQIWNAGDNNGRELQVPRSERELAKKGIQRETIILTGSAGE